MPWSVSKIFETTVPIKPAEMLFELIWHHWLRWVSICFSIFHHRQNGCADSNWQKHIILLPQIAGDHRISGYFLFSMGCFQYWTPIIFLPFPTIAIHSLRCYQCCRWDAMEASSVGHQRQAYLGALDRWDAAPRGGMATDDVSTSWWISIFIDDPSMIIDDLLLVRIN